MTSDNSSTNNRVSLGDLRHEFTKATLSRQQLLPCAIDQFKKWLDEYIALSPVEPTAMTLSTVGQDMQPSARIVLLKGIEAGKFCFFSNYESNKGRQLALNSKAALSFYWHELQRQVIIKGAVEKMSRQASKEYFDSRPRGSRLGAIVSKQSQVVANRDVLEQEMELAAQQHGQEIKLPPYWGGYALLPTSLTFWQGRESRLHDVFVYNYQQDTAQWHIERLYP